MALHRSVMAQEVVEWIQAGPGKVIVDGTVGLGGHAEAILRRSAPDGKLIGFDRDEEALAEAKKRLEGFGERAMLIHENYKNVVPKLKELDLKADGMLLDLGVSSLQLDEPDRGFSFRSEAPLDMRMDRRERLTAKEIVNSYSKDELLKIFWEYGEERFAKRIVDAILRRRMKKTIQTTAELAGVISEAVPVRYRYGRIHPATRCFQALRIEVNQELVSLRFFLDTALEALKEDGRLVVISFHSLEDRMVKNRFKELTFEGKGRGLTKKPLTPSEEEIVANPRAASAKMRVFEKDAGKGPVFSGKEKRGWK